VHAPYCHFWHDFRKSFMEHKTCVLILATNLSEVFLILRRKVRDINTIIHQVKYPLFLSDFNGIYIFSADFRKIYKHQNS
jgi:hypothetical protein